MFAKVFLVFALAFCLAHARHEDVTEEGKYEHFNPLFGYQKPFVKYPFVTDFKHDVEYQKQEHEFPYYQHQYLYQHPFLSRYLNKYNDQQSYVHPYIHGQDYEGIYNHIPYQYGSYHPYYQEHNEGYYYPHNVEYYNQQGIHYPMQWGYEGYVHPFLHKMLGYGYHHYPQYEV